MKSEHRNILNTWAPPSSAICSRARPRCLAFIGFVGADAAQELGALQFEVLADRIRSEYDLPCHFEATSFEVARWVDADDPKLIKKFADANRDNIAEDHSGATVFLARNDWQLNRAKQDFPQLRFPAEPRAGPAHTRHRPDAIGSGARCAFDGVNSTHGCQGRGLAAQLRS